MRRLLKAGLVLLILATLSIAAAGVYVVRRPFPVVQGQRRVPGVRASVEIIRDRWGIPHVFAQNTPDLLFAQGYVHAQDRLWHMEFNRRIASGRLSEIFGDVTLKEDRFLRTVGLRRSAERDLAQLDDETRSALEAYAAGVNAFIAQNRHRLPIEFVVLRFAPEPWTPVDTLAFAKLMAWVLGGNWESEILRAHILSRFGHATAHVLLPPYPGHHPVVVQPVVSNAFRSNAILNLLDLVPRAAGVGSNNWVLSGTRTSTGRPILANDPHLEAQMPSIWYEMHLSGGGYEAIGSTFPGTPGVIVGHNADIAWGVTNA
ncbi:MAG: penicillin acylase family protein, partial [bacterium]